MDFFLVTFSRTQHCTWDSGEATDGLSSVPGVRCSDSMMAVSTAVLQEHPSGTFCEHHVSGARAPVAAGEVTPKM